METAVVVTMGPYPMKLDSGPYRTTWESFAAMAASTNAVVVTGSSFIPVPDLVPTVGPDTSYGDPKWSKKHRGLVAMRRAAADMAREADWLLLLENDVVVPTNLLDRLVAHGKDLIVPRIDIPENPLAKGLTYSPVEQPGQTGLMPIRWAGYPCTLFHMPAFDQFDEMFLGGGEGIDYEQWTNAGIEPYMDLDTPIEMVRLAAAHRIAFEIPGSLRFHHKKGWFGRKVRCTGNLVPVEPVRYAGIAGAIAAECDSCNYSIEFVPPAGNRGEELSALRQRGLLG